jgi:hypothetical protein
MEPLIGPESAYAFMECVASIQDWQVFRMAPVPSENQSLAGMEAAARHSGFNVIRRPYATGFSIMAECGWESYQRSRSRKFIKNIERSVRKIEGDRRLRIGRYSGEECADRMLRFVRTVSGNSWKSRSGVGIFSAEHHGFYERLLAETLAKNKADIWMLFSGNRPIAYEWHIHSGTRTVALKADFDQAFGEVSPGNVLAWKAVEACFARGIEELDYLFGGARYKHRWANHTYALDELLVFRPGGYSGFLHWIYRHQNWIERIWHLDPRRRFQGM